MNDSSGEDLVPSVTGVRPRNDVAEPFRGRVFSVESSGYDSSLSASPDRGASQPSTTTTGATTSTTPPSLADQFFVFVNKYNGEGDDEEEFDGVDSPKRLYNRRGSLEGERAVRAATSTSTSPSTGTPSLSRDYEQLYEYLRLVRSNLEQGLWPGLPPLLDQRQRSECFCHLRSLPDATGCTQSPHTLTPTWSTRLTERTYEECLFCKSRGLDPSMYRSHTMRCPMTRNIICPILTANICRICGDRGDHKVHLDTDCTSQLRRVGSGRFRYHN